MIGRKFLSALSSPRWRGMTVSACGLNSDPLSSDGAAGSGRVGVIIRSADFTESQLIASIYSQAPCRGQRESSVTEQFNIGSREEVAHQRRSRTVRSTWFRNTPARC